MQKVIVKYSRLKEKPTPIFNGPFLALLNFLFWQVQFKAHNMDWASIIFMLLTHRLKLFGGHTRGYFI